MSALFTFPAGFDADIAREAAALVGQAYAQYAAFSASAPWSLQGTYVNLALLLARPEGVIEKLEPFGFVARNTNSQNVFVVFRGTESPGDWLSNVTFQQTKPAWGPAWGEVEEGFWKLYLQCSASVMNGVKAALAPVPGASVYVTGHSLGGALATLAAADLVNANIAISKYTFASPRVGDPVFAAKFNGVAPACWRVANSEDIVTTVPLATATLKTVLLPQSFFAILLDSANHLDFEHVGTPICFTRHLGSIVNNHSMAVYAAALGA